MKVNNSAEAAVGGSWHNPGSKLYNTLMKNNRGALKEVYLMCGDIKDDTPYSRSGCKYPHHVIKGDEIVLSIPGVKAAFSRARQQGVFSGEVKKHLERHYRELGIYKDSEMANEEKMNENFTYIESVINHSLGTHICGSVRIKEVNSPEDLYQWMEQHISYDHIALGKWRLKSPNKTMKCGKGNCHDQALFEVEILRPLVDECDLEFFIEFNEGSNVGGNTHTLAWYRVGRKYYWFEHAWEDIKGIHGPYDSLDELRKDVKRVWAEDNDINSGKYEDILFSHRGDFRIGMSLGEYVESWTFDVDNEKITESMDWIERFVQDDSFRESVGNNMDEEDLEWALSMFVEDAEEASDEEASTDDPPPSIDDEGAEAEQPVEEPEENPEEDNKEEEKIQGIEPKSRPKAADAAENNKNGVRRKKLYIAFIEWAKAYNRKNAFGSIFDKDIFDVSYPFVPHEMRYFYRLANPMLCVLGGDLTFFPVAELRKVNAGNKKLSEMLIFAATPNDLRVFSNKDKQVYLAKEQDGEIVLTQVIGETFDLYIQNMIKQGDILNAPLEQEEPDLTTTPNS